MSLPVFDSATDVATAIRAAIEGAIDGANVEVVPGSPGHYEIQVVSGAFSGKSMVQQQQQVYAAIKHLMAGDNAPVHAVDRLRTSTP